MPFYFRMLPPIIMTCLAVLPASSQWDDRIAAMSVEEKVGQLLITGLDSVQLSPELEELIRDYRLGGFILHPDATRQGPEALNVWLRALQEWAWQDGAGVPLFLGATGDVGALAPLHPLLGGTPTPTPLALGASDRTEDTAAAYRALGQDLKACGYNFLTAPSFDRLGAPWNPALGLHSFGASAEVVAKHAATAVENLDEAGILAWPGHFPGWVLDSTNFISGTPVIDENARTLERLGLAPLRAVVAADASGIMTSHYIVEAWDPLEAVTFSKRILGETLRSELGDDTLIISAPMDWRSANLKYTPGTGALLAIEAGCDVVLQESADPALLRARIDGILAAVRSGRLPEARLDASLRRIFAAKARAGLFENPIPEANPRARMATDGATAAMKEAARHGVVVLSNNKNLIPYTPGPGTIVVVNPPSYAVLPNSSGRVTPLGRTLGHFFRVRAERVIEVPVDPMPSRTQHRAAINRARNAELIVVGVLDVEAAPDYAEMVRELLDLGKPVVIIGMGSPSGLAAFSAAGALIAAHGPHALALEAAVEVTLGAATPGGALPVPVGDAYPAGHRITLNGQ